MGNRVKTVSSEEMEKILKESNEKFNQLSEADKALYRYEQRKSFVRGQLMLSSNRTAEEFEATWPRIDPMAPVVEEFHRMRETLKKIACFDDKHANARLEQSGSYGGFDEPGSVELARQHFKEVKHD